MELKQIPIEKVLANFSQPREEFDKEKIQELSESILSNGLINPISVRVWKDKFMIVAGERRWRASKLAGLKKIDAFVKEYKNEGQMMIESLIENVHREDLKEYEKAKYLLQIKKSQNIGTNKELGKLVGFSEKTISYLLDLVLPGREHLSKAVQKGEITEHHFRAIKTIDNKEEAKKVLEKVKNEKLSSAQTEKLVPVFKKSTPEVKKALLSDEISVEQAERITKLKTPEQRTKAIQEHKNIGLVSRGVERNVEHQETAKEKREADKRLVQVKNWISSLRYSITDSYSKIEKSLKLLMVNVKLISLMDNTQKEKFNEQLDRFLEILEKAEHIVEQVKEKTK
jgi:ParB family chromosome partitioning protein